MAEGCDSERLVMRAVMVSVDRTGKVSLTDVVIVEEYGCDTLPSRMLCYKLYLSWRGFGSRREMVVNPLTGTNTLRGPEFSLVTSHHCPNSSSEPA